MDVFYLFAWLIFSAHKVASLSFHFLGKTPYGDSVVEDPVRFLPNAAVFECGVLLAFALFFGWMERLTRARSSAWKAAFLIFLCGWALLCQFDQEVVRWLGNHVTLSYLRTYLGFRDPHLLWKLTNADLRSFLISVGLGLLPIPLSWILWFRRGRFKFVSGRVLFPAFLVTVAFVAFPFWWNYSPKRWRRICPAGISMTLDAWRSLRGLDKPRHPERALTDLEAYVRQGRSDGAPASSSYPLWRTSPGRLSETEFRAQPELGKPNIVLVVFETWRGWRSGLVPDTSLPTAYAPLDSFLKSESAYFPWMHSNGFPSVEGGISINLGLWPHYNKVIVSDYIHIRTRSLPEILRSLGYHTEMIFGYDPSFDNFTPWMRKWYDRLEYDRTRTEDGPILERARALLDTLSPARPWMLGVWTTSTHPPYDVPDAPAASLESDPNRRYDQSLAYTGKNLLRFFNALKSRSDWNRTVVILVGDHSQPVPWQLKNLERVGELNPGHTWTHLAFFGGWPGFQRRGLQSVTADQVDVAPTLLGMLDVKTRHHFMGRDLFADSVERDVFAARNDHIAIVNGAHRLLFRMDGNSEIAYFRLPRNSKTEYALVQGSEARTESLPSVSPFGMDVERYRDMLRMYVRLLDEDRMMPPGESP